MSRRTYLWCEPCKRISLVRGEARKGDYSCEHLSRLVNSDAQRFTPIAYFQNQAGDVMIPPGNDVLPPDGYVTKTANTLQEVRKLTKHMDSQSREKFYRYEAQRLATKQRNVNANLEFALRAREKMSDPTAKAITDRAISRMRQQLNEGARTFQPSGHFHFMEFDGLRQSR